MKRLSALAQLVAMYREKGVTSTGQLVTATGYAEASIWRAKRELAGVNCDRHCDSDTLSPVTPPPVTRAIPPPVIGDSDTLSPVTGSPDPLPPKRKVSPCTPSKENNPPPPQNLTSFDSVCADAPPASSKPSASKRYVFEGEVIKILEPKFEEWRQTYPEIDLKAELLLADAYYVERPEKIPDGKWYFKVVNWLSKASERAKADKRTARQKLIDSVCPPEIYGGLGLQ